MNKIDKEFNDNFSSHEVYSLNEESGKMEFDYEFHNNIKKFIKEKIKEIVESCPKIKVNQIHELDLFDGNDVRKIRDVIELWKEKTLKDL